MASTNYRVSDFNGSPLEDAMQSLDIEKYEKERQEKLRQDYDSPAAPPSDVLDDISKFHQKLDTEIDIDEWYHRGLDAAVGLPDRSRSAVTKYRRRGA